MITKKPLVTVEVSLPHLDFLILRELLIEGCPKEQLIFTFPENANALDSQEVSFKVSFAVDLESSKAFTNNQKKLHEILKKVSEISNMVQEKIRQTVIEV